MGWFDTILYPLKWVVAWIMVGFHNGVTWLGLPAESGISWALSIVGLVVVIRIILIPLFFKQIKAMRGQQLLQPDLQKLQKKYKGRTDPASKEAMQREMMALYKEHGTNPFASCLPILAQMPIFFALFRVLYSIPDIATGTYAGGDTIGPLGQELAIQFQDSTLFGVLLSARFLDADATWQSRVLTAVLIVMMCVTQFTTQRQLTMKNMPAAALDNPMARQQRMLMYIMPLVFALSGVYFPIGVLIYWLTTNLWTTGQQFYTIRRMPAPGSEAERTFKERQRKKLERKAARKGVPIEELLPEEPEEKKAQSEQPKSGQRVQPQRSKSRRKRPSGPAQQRPQREQASLESAGDSSQNAAEAKVSETDSSVDSSDSPAEQEAKAVSQDEAAQRYAERAAKRRRQRQQRG